MPLLINVGLSKKRSKDFQSEGFSLNIQAELDSALLSRPDHLQLHVQRLYEQAEIALERKIGEGSGSLEEQDKPLRIAPTPSNNGSIRATQAQRQAIFAISRQLGICADTECKEVLGFDPQNLSVIQASKLIHHLKRLQGDT